MKQQKNVTTIGGGSGGPSIIEALVRGGHYIDAICTVMDSGGLTGKRRTDSWGRELAYSDALRSLLALIPPTLDNHPVIEVLRGKWFVSRTEREHLGYIILSHSVMNFNREDGFLGLQKDIEKMIGTNLPGRVIPVTMESSNIAFKTSDNKIYVGEHELDEMSRSGEMVEDIWLEPLPEAYNPALESLSNARNIIITPGSWYGSVLVNLMPKGVKDAYKKSNAQKILITNLVSTRNETHMYSPSNFIENLQKYSGMKKPIDILLVPSISKKEFDQQYHEVSANYKVKDRSYFLGWEDDVIREAENTFGIQIVKHDAIKIDPQYHRIRHDTIKMSEILSKLLK